MIFHGLMMLIKAAGPYMKQINGKPNQSPLTSVLERQTTILKRLSDNSDQNCIDIPFIKDKINGQHVKLDCIKTNVDGIEKEMSFNYRAFDNVNKKLDSIEDKIWGRK